MANPETNANDQASASTNAPNTNARAKFEAERITRRAALRKFGFGAGMAALLALSTDDLARMAAAKLKQQAGDNQVANQVANEFKNAGVAFAEASGPPWGCGDCGSSCVDSPTVQCNACGWGCSGYYPSAKKCSYNTTNADCKACCDARNTTVAERGTCYLESQCASKP